GELVRQHRLASECLQELAVRRTAPRGAVRTGAGFPGRAAPVLHPGSLFWRHAVAENGGMRTMKTMPVMVELCVVPVGVGTSLSDYIAACARVLEESGLEHEMHDYGTNIVGEWDAVFAAIRKCHEVVHAMGAPRIFTTLKIGTEIGRTRQLNEKVASVQRKLAQR